MKKILKISSIIPLIVPITYSVSCGSNGVKKEKDLNDEKILNTNQKEPISLHDAYSRLTGEVIPPYAFDGDVLPSGFKIPNYIKEIAAYAFYHTTLPVGFDFKLDGTNWTGNISWSAFSDCIIPSNGIWYDTTSNKYSLTSSIKPTFELRDLTRSDMTNAHLTGDMPSWFQLPEGMARISAGMFYQMNFTRQFKIPSSVKTIEANAFDSVAITNDFVIPNTVESIDENAFPNLKVWDNRFYNNWNWVDENGFESKIPKPGSHMKIYK